MEKKGKVTGWSLGTLALSSSTENRVTDLTRRCCPMGCAGGKGTAGTCDLVMERRLEGAEPVSVLTAETGVHSHLGRGTAGSVTDCQKLITGHHI